MNGKININYFYKNMKNFKSKSKNQDLRAKFKIKDRAVC